MEESKTNYPVRYTIGEIVELIKSVDDLKSKVGKQMLEIAVLEHQIEFKYNDMKYVLIKRQTLRDIVSTLEDTVANSITDAENVIRDIESSASDAEYSIGDSQSSVGNCISDIETLLEEPDPNDSGFVLFDE